MKMIVKVFKTLDLAYLKEKYTILIEYYSIFEKLILTKIFVQEMYGV